MIEKKARIVRSEGIKGGFRFHLEFEHDQPLGVYVDVVVPEPPKPAEKTPGQKLYEERSGGTCSWDGATVESRNRYHAAAHALAGGTGPAPTEPAPVKSPGERLFLAYLKAVEISAYPYNWRTLPANQRAFFEQQAAAYDARSE